MTKRAWQLVALGVLAAVAGGAAWLRSHEPTTTEPLDAAPDVTRVPLTPSATLDAAREADEYPVEHEASTIAPECWARWLANRDAFDAKWRAVDGCAPTGDQPELGCLAHDDVTWTTEVVDASVVADCAFDLTLRFARMTDAGVALGAPFASRYAWNETQRISFRALSDYDHDGVTEILASVATDAKEGLHGASSTVLTVRDGGVVPYAPAASFQPSDAADVDHDGLVDLVGRGPYASFTALGTLSELFVAPEIFVAHARPDGTFSTTDPVARDYTKRACASAPTKLTGMPDDMQADARAIVCARVNGTAPGTILAWIERACPEDAGPYDCLRWETRLTAIAP